MRIVTRPDFDGVVCAVIIKKAERITKPIKWVEPSDIQNKITEIKKGDILANLPLDNRCSKWFDHHVSNKQQNSFPGAFEIAPSAAGVAYEYYKDVLNKNYDTLIAQTDKIDAALLSLDEVRFPENHPYILLSMTITNREVDDSKYWNLIVELLEIKNIHEILEIDEVKKRCLNVIAENSRYKEILKHYVSIKGNISVIDFREFDIPPSGNRFIVYSMYPDISANVKIRFNESDKNKINLSIAHNIFNKKCNVNIGKLLSRYGGGGHFGAGGCSFPKDKANLYIPEIINVLNNCNHNGS